jgi:RNA polymerase-binding transcription factor DksA
MENVATRLCRICQRPISEERLEILPNTDLCVDCARAHPPAPISAEKLDISQASPITRNGFAPKD